MTSFIKVTVINHIQVWNARHGLSSLICLLLMRDSYPCPHLEYRLVSCRYEILLFRKSSGYRALVWQANGTTKILRGKCILSSHLETQSQSFEVCIILCFRMSLTAKRKWIAVRKRAEDVCRDYFSKPEPAFHLVHGDEVVNRGSACLHRMAGRRGRQNARVWQTWQGYYLRLLTWSSLNINVFWSFSKRSA